jgi:hypothetical protein
MPKKTLPLLTSLTLLGALAAAPALADAGWDHRAMQSHHQAADRVEPRLAPGEKRVGRILIGAPAATPNAAVPETLESATQRQWHQRSSFSDGGSGTKFNAPRVRAGRYDGTPGVSHSSPGR